MCFAFFHSTWGPLPSQDELDDHLGTRNPGHRGSSAGHWSDWGSRWNRSENRKHRDLSLADFCQRYETVELLFDVGPEDQLKLIWLLDYFRAYPEAVARLKLRLVDLNMSRIGPGGISDWRPPIVDVTERELATARAAWQAYRSPTPEACVNLLQTDLSALPLLKPVLLDLLAELPSASTGLGASEMRMLEMIGRGYSRTNDLFYRSDVRQTRVFNEFEYGYLLDGLAFGPVPAVLGLDEHDLVSHAPQRLLDCRLTGIDDAAGDQPPADHADAQCQRNLPRSPRFRSSQDARLWRRL